MNQKQDSSSIKSGKHSNLEKSLIEREMISNQSFENK